MISTKKQLKINKLFKKKRTITPEDCEELETEVHQLQQKLKEKETELFQIQRHCLKRKPVPPKKTNEEFMRPEKIVFKNAIQHVEKQLELYTMLTGMEVHSYLKDDHCCVMYHMQHHSRSALRHGLKISLATDNHELTNFSLPLGFQYNSVMCNYEKIMTPQSLGAVRKGLMAYYDRLEQIEALKAVIPTSNLFKLLDGSHVEINFKVKSVVNTEVVPLDVMFILDYRVYDIRPKHYSFREFDLPKDTVELLKEQCAVFKRMPLEQAFRECFIDGSGPYKLDIDNDVEQEREENRRQYGKRRNYNYDTTFNPQDDSDFEN